MFADRWNYTFAVVCSLKGKGLKRASGDCPNELLCQAEVASPLISKKLSNPEKPELKRIYEYDLKTEPGKSGMSCMQSKELTEMNHL
mgnify:CR=1 FL=1